MPLAEIYVALLIIYFVQYEYDVCLLFVVYSVFQQINAIWTVV